MDTSADTWGKKTTPRRVWTSAVLWSTRCIPQCIAKAANNRCSLTHQYIPSSLALTQENLDMMPGINYQLRCILMTTRRCLTTFKIGQNQVPRPDPILSGSGLNQRDRGQVKTGGRERETDGGREGRQKVRTEGDREGERGKESEEGGERRLTSLTGTWMRGYSENKKSTLLLSKPLWHFRRSTFHQAEAADIRPLSGDGQLGC